MLSDTTWGYLAIIGANLTFGSFGVPIKTPKVVKANVHPVAFQCYKSFTVFATAWLVLLFTDFTFTWWGFVGATIWVINGVVAIYIIRLIGLGISQGIWSGVTIWVSFLWGALVFDNEVKSWPLALTGVALMFFGIIGLALVASRGGTRPTPPRGSSVASTGAIEKDALLLHAEVQTGDGDVSGSLSDRGDGLAVPDESLPPTRARFWIGVALAVYIGVANGSMMVPFEYAPKDAHGAEYVISFGIGAVSVNAVVFAAFSAYQVARGLPALSLQFRVAAGPAFLTGLLWASGNLCSIFATKLVSYSVGFTLVQMNLIVSSLWGLLYYREIRGWVNTVAFFASLGVVLAGVALLGLYG